MNIALIGTRGVPANYGGFETCVENLGINLVKRGHSVTVYCRAGYYKKKLNTYLGMKLIYLPNLKRKSLDTLSHTFLSILHAVRQSYDILMVFNAANSPTLALPHLLGMKIVINTDGLEWKRGKWSNFGKRYYKFSEWLSTKLANRIVADSRIIRDYYKESYGVDSTHIAYGAYINKSRRAELLSTLGMQPGKYFLQITRFEPENNPLLTIRAHRRLKTEKKLVLVGGVHYQSKYSKQINAETKKNQKIILPGFIYNKEFLNELWCNCYAYIHGNEAGGTNPALLQSMASGCFTIALDVPFNHDVLQDGGIYYKKNPDNLASKLQWALEHHAELHDFKEIAVKRIKEHYTWQRVTDCYEELFHKLIGRKKK